MGNKQAGNFAHGPIGANTRAGGSFGEENSLPYGTYKNGLIGPRWQTRSFSAVLFRRIATRARKDPVSGQTKDLFLTLQPPERNAIRAKLSHCIAAESLP
jgi:hypothetical protein